MRLRSKMVAAAMLVMVFAAVAWAAVPTRSEVVKKYADKSPKQWGETLPGIARTLDTRDDVVALTLDLCQGDASAFDRELVAFLIENEIPATFFVSSRWIKQHADDLAMLASVPIFEIGAHGVRHVPASLNGRAIYGITGTKDAGELYDEVMQNVDEIERATGARPKFFRSGTAFYDEYAVAMIRELGMMPVGYSVLGDAGATYSADQVVAAVTSARSGDIIIAHANHPDSGTGRGLIRALPILRAKGFSFVKLSDRLKQDQNDSSNAVTADEMARRFGMQPHEENGRFVERHPAASGDGRPASGCI